MLIALVAAQRPAALGVTEPGLWEIRGVRGLAATDRLCVADTLALAQYEHRSQSCTRIVVSDAPATSLIHYTCAKGGFGQTRVTLVTPRSLRIETQGISNDFPFNYVVHARRLGNCGVH